MNTEARNLLDSLKAELQERSEHTTDHTDWNTSELNTLIVIKGECQPSSRLAHTVTVGTRLSDPAQSHTSIGQTSAKESRVSPNIAHRAHSDS